jgi:hypothetical protein
MTQDEIIEMAIDVYGSVHEDDIKFAKLVAAAERDACALIVEANADACRSDGVAQMYLYSNAQAIRNRGKA